MTGPSPSTRRPSPPAHPSASTSEQAPTPTGAWPWPAWSPATAITTLVLQRIDGIEPDIVWRLNAGAYVPDLTVLLNADHPVIADRLRQRGAHSRFERQPGGSRAESDLYHRAAAELHAAGWPVLALDCTLRRPESIAMMIAVPVIHSYRERSQACPS